MVALARLCEPPDSSGCFKGGAGGGGQCAGEELGRGGVAGNRRQIFSPPLPVNDDISN